jgi:hypothetical protein
MQTYKVLKVDYVFEGAKFPKGRGQYFLENMAPRGDKFPRKFGLWGPKLGGQISWDTGILYGMFYIVYNKDLQI